MKLQKNKKGFELNNLYGFVLMLVMIGLIIGVGVLILDKFSTAVYLDETVTNESVVTPANRTGINLVHNRLSKFISFVNLSGDAYPGENYTVDLVAGTINITYNNTQCWTGQTCYASYEWYNYGSTAVTALNNSRAAVTPIASTWLTLIVTIVVLAIILTIVIRSFAVKGR